MATLARWQGTIQDDDGNAVPGASVTVRRESDNGLASLFTDEAGSNATGNPVSADADGYIFFHVVGGSYKITAVSGSFSRVWRYVRIGTAQGSDASAFALSATTRLKSASAITYHVRDDATGDTGRDGTVNTPAGAFLTGAGLATYLRENVDFGGFQPTISLSPGVFAPFTFAHPWMGGTYPNLNGDPARTITNVVSNGGLCRLTVPTGAQGGRRALQTGDKVLVWGVLGATGANTSPSAGPATITVINSTTVDIQGSTFGGAYTSGGKMVCTIIQATGNSQVGINLQDYSVLAPGDCGFDSGGFSGFNGLQGGQYSILDPGANTYHRASVHVLLSPCASLNESAVPAITGNAAAHMQIMQGARASIFQSRYVAGGLTISFVKQVYYNAILTASGAVVYTGPGARGGASPVTGQQYIKYKGGEFTDGITDSTWPGNTDGVDHNVYGPAAAVVANALARWNGATGNLIKSSPVIVDDSGNVSGVAGLTATGAVLAAGNPKFSVYASADASINDATATKIQMNTEEFDIGANFDNATNFRHTPQIAGKYKYTFQVTWDSPEVGAILFSYIHKNGAAHKATIEQAANTNFKSVKVEAFINMNGTTDYVEFFGYQDSPSGAAETILEGALYTWATGHLVP